MAINQTQASFNGKRKRESKKQRTEEEGAENGKKQAVAQEPQQQPLPSSLTNPLMLPITPSASGTKDPNSAPKLIVVLSQACLENYAQTVNSSSSSSSNNKKPGNKQVKYTLLNCDDHQSILARMGKDIAATRPDITHQCLLTLLDSPVNRAGRLQVFIHTSAGVLIEIHPSVRIPRTFKRFSGLMVQLLHQLSIRSTTGKEKLLKVIKNPISDHLPPNSHKITLSFDAPPVKVSEYVTTIPSDKHLVVFVGAMAHGDDDFADHLVDEKIAISQYSLSASVACGKFCCAVEDHWGIL
ncbi:hypothetical protein MJO28_001314 [Puccinia striiformis f. sp. tritici]|uniref:Ribosomal RNA small subunit methyltransferase NEP1 n=3 Tax=Puccinia striiformis TaxID=27350 RepID=A0A0L0VDM5_9BASI|nr:hypothetical protein Pst134EB_004495 [Puccinia striiformis f. sp. tritici]KAI9611624.1 hypothetical protein H4Q26_008579 [Puccinia striiformis f. sp. tritici PST-130]KNE97412.1 hypothetical protein PSTG_09383 [Puccinia striiformis f. sp. tritici PST-78]POW10616.1 hypothetical protein PSHT_08681 [Puccinia striiformis]KAI7960825.1 hypothetical protein MJO28_001314 [Puccinia striiformis f. sp. tritici]